jgi:hypothetical protein
MAPELSPVGEKLRLLKRSTMNSRLPERMVSPMENPSHEKHSPFVVMVSADDGTIRMSKGKARCQSPFLARRPSVFFAPTRYKVVKITRTYSDMAL